MADDKTCEDDSAAYIVNADKQKLYCYTWKPQLEEGQNPKALVFISHGLAEHCGWHATYAEKLAEEGMLVFGHDHVGHGRSEGEPVYIDDIQVYIRDVRQHITEVTADYPDIPLFIVGYSMGGTIALMLGFQEPKLFRGMVMLAPAIMPDANLVPAWKLFFGRMVSYIIPRLPVSKLDPNAMSTDPAVVERYIADPLVWHGYMKGRPTLLLLDAMTHIMSHLADITWPIFFLQGDIDPLCALAGPQAVMDKASSTDKTLKVMKGAYHLVHWEPKGEGTQAVKDIVDWVKERCTP